MDHDTSQTNDAGFLEDWEAGEPETGGAEESGAPEGGDGAEAPGLPGLPGSPGPGLPVTPGKPGPLGPGAFGPAGREARVQADLRTFAAAFPEAARDPASIPGAVWGMVRQGRTLTDAYAAFRAVRERAGRQNARSAFRSAGSMRSAGSGAGPRDPFLEGWES